jgi:hypothetical protein
VAAGLEQHLLAPVGQRAHQLERAGLQHRLPAGELNQLAGVALDGRQDLVHRELVAFVESVLGVAPGAAQVAARQPDEDARHAHA